MKIPEGFGDNDISVRENRQPNHNRQRALYISIIQEFDQLYRTIGTNAGDIIEFICTQVEQHPSDFFKATKTNPELHFYCVKQDFGTFWSRMRADCGVRPPEEDDEQHNYATLREHYLSVGKD